MKKTELFVLLLLLLRLLTHDIAYYRQNQIQDNEVHDDIESFLEKQTNKIN